MSNQSRSEDWRFIAAFIAAPDEPSRLSLLRNAGPSLRKHIDEILSSPEDHDFLEVPFFVPGGEILELRATPSDPLANPEWWVGKKVDAYTLLRLLPKGTGGQGFVFEAEESGEITRKVAFKLMRPDLLDDVNYQFQRERQILADIDSSWIVPLLRAGHHEVETGRQYPFFVMPLVDGVWITEYCENHNLNLNDRLVIFLKVCAAVGDAHDHLILHRDLKPSNVLVTGRGDIRLLDFGIADEVVAGYIDTGGLVGPMTVAYASPEQLAGMPLDVRTDVFSLGLILYEMLTGCRAQSATELQVSAMLGHLTIPSPVPPSRCPSVGARREKELRGDLDCILVKALARDLDSRYKTVREFASDLERFLVKLPVHARPLSLQYRAQKWLSRNRILSAVITIGVVLVAIAFEREVAARKQAESRTDELRHLAARMAGMVDVIDTETSLDAKRHAVEQARDQLERLLGTGSTTTPDLLVDLAETYQRLGDVQGRKSHANQGDLAGALVSYKKCSELLQHAGEKAPPKQIAKCIMKTADILTDLDKNEVAQGLYTQALEIDRKELANRPEDRLLRANVAFDLQRLGNTQLRLVRYKEAEKYYVASLTIFESLGQPPTVDAVETSNLGIGYIKMGELERARGNLMASLGWFKKAEQCGQLRIHNQPNNREALRYYSVDLNSIAKVLTEMGKLREAIQYAERSLAIDDQLQGEEPFDLQARRDVTISLNDLGALYRTTGRLRDSERALQRSFVVALERLSVMPASKEAILDVTGALHQLTETLTDLNRFSRARETVVEASKRLQSLVARNSNDAEVVREMIIDRYQAARVERMSGEFVKAARLYQSTYELYKASTSTDEPTQRISMEEADILAAWGVSLSKTEPREAKRRLTPAIRTLSDGASGGEFNSDVSMELAEALAAYASMANGSAEAKVFFIRSTRLIEMVLVTTPNRIEALRIAAEVHFGFGRYFAANRDLAAAGDEYRRSLSCLSRIDTRGLTNPLDRQLRVAVEDLLR